MKRVAAFPSVHQHSEISIIHSILILILFLPCVFWCYPLFHCVYKSSTVDVFLSFGSPLYIIFMSIYPYLLFETQLRICAVNRNVWREVFEKFLRTKLFLVKFQTFPFQVFTFQEISPGILIPNSQTRHFSWSIIKKTMKFHKGHNSSRWSLYADLEAAVENVL